MDHTRDQSLNAAKKRLDSFRIGHNKPRKPVPQLPPSPTESPTSTTSFRNSLIQSFSAPNIPSTEQPRSRPSSHHRRRSSVSTRRESAEMMGVTYHEPASSEALGDNNHSTDSVRRRALWALEGKLSSSNNVVEIPELESPTSDSAVGKRFDFTNSAPLPSFGIGNNLSGKRDSFGKLLASTSASSKEQLHTLLEEEEEDEEEDETEAMSKTIPAPVFVEENSDDSSAKITAPLRPRPALRPLSLTPRNLSSQASSLPTPSPTPSPRNGLRSLTLSPTPLSNNNLRQHSAMSTSPSEAMLSSGNPRGTSSISYRRTQDLPTPEETPTHFSAGFGGFASRGHRPSCGSASSYESRDDYHYRESDRSLSPSEQHFLHRSHTTLLARITELEKALRVERRSSSRMGLNQTQPRPVSFAASESGGSDSASFVSAYSESGPSDEMLRLITDLKAERDELSRDIDGWRVRTADLEKQLSLLMRRVESERRDAWVAREQVGQLGHEKDGLQARIMELERENARLQTQHSQVKDEALAVGRECESERQRRQELESILDDMSFHRAPTKRDFRPFGRGSESSSTDVEDIYVDSPSSMLFSKLKAVAEVEENTDFGTEGVLDVPGDVYEDEDEDEEDELARYEEGMDSDESFISGSLSGSSMDSTRSIDHFQPAANDARLNFPSSPTPPPQPFDGQLVTGWTFAKSVYRERQTEPVDRFFRCLDDLDVDDSPPAIKITEGLFSAVVEDDEDDGVDFVIPLQSSASVPSQLECVLEEDEEEEAGEDYDDEGSYEGPSFPIEITITEHHDDDRTTTSTLNLVGDDAPDEFYADADMTITAISMPSEPTTPTTSNPRNPYATPTRSFSTSSSPYPSPPSPTFIPQPKFRYSNSFMTPPRAPTAIHITPPSPRRASPTSFAFSKPTMIPQPKNSPSTRSLSSLGFPDDSSSSSPRSTAGVNGGLLHRLVSSLTSASPRRYVPKERQLEKLRRRMSVDSGSIPPCRGCTDAIVSV